MQHSFDVQIAKQYGIPCAVLLNHIWFWTEKNKANNANYYDGHYWTYNSKKAFAELFPYMNERQIEYALNKLIKDDLIKTGNYNKSTYDRTLWYTITEKGYCILQNCGMHPTKLWNASNNNVDSNTNINTNINKESIDIDSCAQPKVEHEKPQKTKNIKTQKRSLIPNSDRSDLEELKKQTTSTSTTPAKLVQDKKDYKRQSFINKAMEIIVTQLKISDENIICLIKDWLDVCYDKGITTQKARFKHIVDDLKNVIDKYDTKKVSDILHATIVGGYTALSYAIQNLEKTQYNRPHTKAEDYKFPGIKKDETVEEYLARTHESPEEHQKRMEELKQKKKRGELKSY